MIYDSGDDHDIVSCRAQTDIPIGSYVKISGSDCFLPGLTTDISAGDGGVVCHSSLPATQVGYKAGDIVPVMRRGRVWVASETANTVYNSMPFVRFTVNGANGVGGFRVDADAGKAVQRTGLTIYRGTPGAGVMVVYLQPLGL